VGSLLPSDLAPAFADSGQVKLAKTKKIDFHCHSFPADALRELNKYYPDVIKLKEAPDGTLLAIFGDVAHPAWDHALRIKDIDADGVNLELLSFPPVYISLDGLELLPRWDFHPLFMPAFAGRTLLRTNPAVEAG